MKRKVVGLGEVLWDVFPDRKCLGGAPSNFAYITMLMGNRGIVASRVGEDALGREALKRLNELGLDINYVQKDGKRATGTVKVEVDGNGQAQFEIAHPVAWDFLEWTPGWKQLAQQADAVCFGSLAQRSPASRTTIRRFLDETVPQAVKVFDVNLRQSFYSPEVIAESMKLADLVKLNDDELPKIMKLCGLPHQHELSSAKRLLDSYELKLVCVTRGGRGSLLVRGGEADEHPGFRVRVGDTVGAGDAFTAALIHEYLQGAALAQMNQTANIVGAWVASETGAMPRPPGGALEDSLREIRRLQLPLAK
jgi:fructokinase